MRRLLLPAAIIGTLALAACGSSAGAVTTSAPTAVASSTGSTTLSSPPASAKVNANTATIGELQRAFEAAGISNAARWAREVDEYRPYPSDPSFAKLRGELAKYNPGSETLEKIIATLTV